ncbi:MAG: hypothetical protein M3178_19095 [Pseudomonadota bacterium]|nr:hypothetical protein [Pseudomonadota bacterium]
MTRLDRLARSTRDLLNTLEAITGNDYLEEALSYHPPENLTPGGFPNSRKRDSMQHVVDSRSGQYVDNQDYISGSLS